jgi:Protein of unknown function (DUF3093)
MRVYHERLRVPSLWWLLGLITVSLLGTELVAGFGWAATLAVYAAFLAGCAALLLSLGRAVVDVAGGELRAGPARLPLAAAGEVAALNEAQTRALRGPRADPAAVVVTRPYLRTGVYVEVTAGGALILAGKAAAAGRHVPYLLVGTRHPERLAAAINSARPAARAGGPPVG